MSSPLLAALVDDAAVFPPGNAPMREAVAAHHRHREAPYRDLVGRFLCPASRLDELRAELGGLVAAAPRGGRRDVDGLRLGLIADTGLPGLPAALATVAADPRLVLEAVEIRLLPSAPDLAVATRDLLAELPARALAFIEVPRAVGSEPALEVLATAGRGAKLRTGGPAPADVPSVEDVAAFVSACAGLGVPYKCTAGLHHAVRQPDPAIGVVHHGFLNLLLAADAALTGTDPGSALTETDGPALAERARALDETAAKRIRALFAGFGSCSIAEPVADPTVLGLLP